MKKYDVIIIGAGSAGLSARTEVAKKTQNYVVIDDGPLGTTCARVGCMPSKVLIQVANNFHLKNVFSDIGINGAEGLTIDSIKVMSHVRKLRDRFVRSVTSAMDDWSDKLIRSRAVFVDPHTLDLGSEQIYGEKIIIATGSRTLIPKPWQQYQDYFLDPNTIFELEQLPKSIAVVGLGVIGLELGQALSRLGVEVIGITRNRALGGASDPEVQEQAIKALSSEFKIYFNGAEFKNVDENNQLLVSADGHTYKVDRAIISVGRIPNLDQLGLNKLSLTQDTSFVPLFNKKTMQLSEAPHIFIAGDVTNERTLLHEASDEGKIAGYNAVNEVMSFKEKPFLGVVFSDPNLFTVGENFQALSKNNAPFIIGQVSFEGQGRSIASLKEKGVLRIYSDKKGKILGAEMFGPSGEHIAHHLAWAMTKDLTVFDLLKMPFYHPVIEEGLRTALRDCALQVTEGQYSPMDELIRCD